MMYPPKIANKTLLTNPPYSMDMIRIKSINCGKPTRLLLAGCFFSYLANVLE